MLTEEIKSDLAKVDTIDGWLSRLEAATLYDLASKANGPIVEIGSWRGKSTSALALGSMSGNKQPVYAVDSFVGITKNDRPTCFGTKAGLNSSSPEILRSNLDAVGVNGLVRIVPKSSLAAAPEIPDCGLLFVDGAHDYESVRQDLETYLPKVKLGGFVAIHDCHDADPGVAKAADELMQADQWRCRWRADTAVIFERRNTLRHKVLLGFPGGTLEYGAAKGLMEATLGAHEVYHEQSSMGWDDMNRLWVFALNCAARGKYTHFAMLHSDIMPSPGWVDLLLDELDDRDGDLISATAALKDENGLTSCGVGDGNPWQPFRRFAQHELMQMPETFGIVDTPHPDKYLLHNSGCWIADLRKRLWRTTDASGCLVADFSFPIRARLDSHTGDFIHERESEDWHFSRMIAGLGAKTFATRRVSTVHFGKKGFRNDHAWGLMKHDEPTRSKWGGV